MKRKQLNIHNKPSPLLSLISSIYIFYIIVGTVRSLLFSFKHFSFFFILVTILIATAGVLTLSQFSNKVQLNSTDEINLKSKYGKLYGMIMIGFIVISLYDLGISQFYELSPYKEIAKEVCRVSNSSPYHYCERSHQFVNDHVSLKKSSTEKLKLNKF